MPAAPSRVAPLRIAIDIRRAGDFGVGTYLRNVIGWLARIDQKNSYLLIGKRKHFDELGPLPPSFSLLEFSAEPGTFRTHFHLPGILHRRRVDLLHMPWFYAPAFLLTPLVVTIHDLTEVLTPQVGGSPIVQAGRLFFARRALSRARRVLAVSESSKRDLSRAFDVPESKIGVIYDALDERFLREPLPADTDRILERHAVTHPFVLYAGNIRPQKNLARLIEAFAVVKSELRGDPELGTLKLMVIGDDLSKHPDLRRAVVRTRLREDVRFLGFVPHATLRAFYARARAFLFPSLYEGFGLPPLEAMAHGTPVLTSNVSSLPEIFSDAALLVNPENVFEIARGIRQILTEGVLRETLIRRGHECVARYSWEHAAREILKVYEETAARREAD